MSVQLIKIDAIRMDGGTQSRAAISDDVVADYAETVSGGQDLPPVTIYFDGKAYWLADGFHRTHAYIKAGAKEIEADIRQGDRREAILHSVGANASHGLRRTNADKRRAVETLLRDDEWSGWADRDIARQCGVSHPFVAKLKGAVTGNVSSEKPQERTYTDKHGNTSTMDTSNIGVKKPADEPDTSETTTPPAADTAPNDNPEGDDAPEPVEPPRPISPYASLTREALEDDHAGAVEEISTLKIEVAKRGDEIDRLKELNAMLSSDGQGAIISRLERQRITLKGKMQDYQAATKREEYKRRRAEEERDAALRSLENQIIPL